MLDLKVFGSQLWLARATVGWRLDPITSHLYSVFTTASSVTGWLLKH